ncbi:C10 family peptidase [Desulfobulbus sp. TB]|nr:C10 family peptidase [Desulfobulbus sp. TB]
MNKTFVAILLSFLFAIHNAAAKPVKEEKIKQFSKNWALEKWGKKIDKVSTRKKATVQLAGTATNLYYILSFPQGGWMIISGDDVVYPVIAFSSTGTYSEQDRPIQFEEWMENVKKEISSAIKLKHAPLPKAAATWGRFSVSADSFTPDESSVIAEEDLATASAGPLLSTEWGQSTYYNDYCPVDYDGLDDHALVGCVAVAMAQVMKYHNFPETGFGSHSYSHSTYGTLSADFGSTTYDWDSMPDSLSDYDSDIAELLYHAGVSVDMNYGPSSSGASTGATVTALKTYFGYSDTASYVRKSDYSGEDWTALLREEIDNNRPVIYRGYNIGTGSGHAFVCDGYSGSDYFHFNWGWYGSYQDEFFYLNDLTPGSHDYSDSQVAVIGIAPDINDPPVGYFDSADCTSFSGWAKDPDTTDPIYIHFYADGPAGTGTFVGAALADVYRGDLPYDDKNHGFSFAFPDSLNDGVGHQVYAYAIDSGGGANLLLTNSPKTVQCGLTADQLMAVISVIENIILADDEEESNKGWLPAILKMLLFKE